VKITVIGASGLIGTKVVELLTAEGHQALSASRQSGVDVLTGEGLAEALANADVLVDVVNSPSFDDESGDYREGGRGGSLRRAVDRRAWRIAGKRSSKSSPTGSSPR
jgi:uncharacterized protein YbjT (DUF2867 family)